MNGSGHGAIDIRVKTRDKWVIAFASNGMGYIGEPDEAARLDDAWLVIRSALEYRTGIQLQQGPRGEIAGIGRQRIILPLEHMASAVPVRIQAVLVYRLADFDRDERAMLEREIDSAEDGRQQIRASRSGLVVTGSIPTGLPPMPRRQ